MKRSQFFAAMFGSLICGIKSVFGFTEKEEPKIDHYNSIYLYSTHDNDRAWDRHMTTIYIHPLRTSDGTIVDYSISYSRDLFSANPHDGRIDSLKDAVNTKDKTKILRYDDCVPDKQRAFYTAEGELFPPMYQTWFINQQQESL